VYLHCCALYFRDTIFCTYTVLHCVVEIQIIVFRAGFKTMEEKEYLLHAPHRITSIFRTHDFHHFHSHNTIFVTYITGIQVIFFLFLFWHHSPWWTLASSKYFLHCSVQVIIFFFFCGLFLQHCLTLYSFDGRKIYVKV
jgi:hypothetical protein